MSFSSDAKEEICRQKLDRRCCTIAESCGVLLYCHTFSPDMIRISTSNTNFTARLPKLFRKRSIFPLMSSRRRMQSAGAVC